MQIKKLLLTDFTDSIAGMLDYNAKIYPTNQNERDKILKIVGKAVCGELTDRQRECIIMRYCQKLTVTDIAFKLGVGKSTVSRHIKKARARLHRVLDYYISTN